MYGYGYGMYDIVTFVVSGAFHEVAMLGIMTGTLLMGIGVLVIAWYIRKIYNLYRSEFSSKI